MDSIDSNEEGKSANKVLTYKYYDSHNNKTKKMDRMIGLLDQWWSTILGTIGIIEKRNLFNLFIGNDNKAVENFKIWNK